MATGVQTIPKIFVTRMRFDDIPAVMALDRECFATPWSENAYQTELSNQCAEYYVAWSGGDLVGYAGIWFIIDEVHVTTLGVAARSRGQKIGERLLMRLLDAAKEHEAQRMTLEVRKSNRVARSLYAKYGFRDAAIRKAYYSDNNEDAVVMWVDDIWSPAYTELLSAREAALRLLEEPRPAE
jgi:ribosomal-protein-alanine N-acetyltransferase